MTEVQPMKMAAAEALYESVRQQRAVLGLHRRLARRQRGEVRGHRARAAVSFLATGNFDGAVKGINELKAEYAEKYGASGNPLVADATLRAEHPAVLLVLPPHDRASASPRWRPRPPCCGPPAATGYPTRPVVDLARSSLTPLLPVFGNSFGWIFTEIGRQPWLVFGLMATTTGVSPSVSAGEVVTSMVVYTLLYGVLAVVEIKLFLHLRAGRGAGPSRSPPTGPTRTRTPRSAFAY